MYWALKLICGLNCVFGRSIAFYMSIYLAASELDYYKAAAGDKILRSPPSDPTLVPSLRIFSVLSIFSIPWIFLVQYVNALALSEDCKDGSKSKGLSTLVGFIDLIIGVWLALALKWQTGFLPITDSNCSAAANWQVPDGHENIFQRFADLDGLLAADECSQLVVNWRLAAGITTLTLLASLLEFLNGSFVGFAKLCRAIGGGILPATRYMPNVVFRLAKLIYDGSSWLVIKVGLFIPRRLAPPVRYRSRYWKRSRGNHNSLPTHELRIWQVGVLSREQVFFESDTTGSKGVRSTILLNQLPPLPLLQPPMIRLLSSEAKESIILNIANFLHYSDIVNLSLASRAVRSQLFGSSSLAEALRIASCISLKSECYCCNMQICNSCQTTHTLPPTETSRHLHTCEVICSTCYRTKICGEKSFHSPSVCACTSTNSTTTATSKKRNRNTTTLSDRSNSLCRNCVDLGDKGLSIREKRERSEIVHLAGQELKCGNCKMRVPAEVRVRWWVCGKCGMECLDEVHPKLIGNVKAGRKDR